MSRENFPNYSDKAYGTLRPILRIHVMPTLGPKKARLVSGDDCASILRTLFEAEYSKHTISKARGVLDILLIKSGRVRQRVNELV